MTKQMFLASAVVLAVSASASAAIVASWSIPTAIPAATTGSNYVYGAADAGDATAGTSLSAFHALAATTWSSPSGNGSTYSLSSNNWSVGDYYQITLSTLGYGNVSLSWDQTRSSTGPSSFRVDVIRGLARARKELPCKWLYDEAGSALFEQICELPLGALWA